MSVAVLDDYQSVALQCADWSAVSEEFTISVFTDNLRDEDALVARLYPFTVICLMRERTAMPASLLSRLPNLKLLITTAMKNRSVDIDAAHSLGVTVSGTRSGGESTTEHIWALILGIARNIAEEDARIRDITRASPWQAGRLPTGLHSRTLGLIGLGRLGQAVAKIALVFGMRVIAWSPNLTAETCAQYGVEYAAKHELFSQSDFVSVHVVLSPRSVNLIDSADLAVMKPTAFLINTSRGPIVNEQALVHALNNNVIAGAALDVFDLEPLPLSSDLRKIPQHKLLLSPHMGYVADDAYRTFFEDTVEDILMWKKGAPIRTL